MKQYMIKRLPAGTAHGEIDWNTIPTAEIDTYLWPEGYAPRSQAKLLYIRDEGFVLRMICAETEPKAIYHHYNEPVYTDSCLEFFADWTGAGAYINMEMNPLGTLLSCIGEGRENRMPIKDICGDIFPVEGSIDPHAWSVTAWIPLSMLATLYNEDTAAFVTRLTPGYTFRGNFYKCGDQTPIPHYGMWNPVGTEQPDFHRPEFFGTLVLE